MSHLNYSKKRRVELSTLDFTNNNNNNTQIVINEIYKFDQKYNQILQEMFKNINKIGLLITQTKNEIEVIKNEIHNDKINYNNNINLIKQDIDEIKNIILSNINNHNNQNNSIISSNNSNANNNNEESNNNSNNNISDNFNYYS